MNSINNGECNVDGCKKLLLCRGMCSAHYKKFIRSGGEKVNISRVCSIEGCIKKSHSKGYCKVHYLRIKRTGSPDRKYEDHGARHTKEYRTWCGIKQRCLNPNNGGFTDYGARGITMAKEWQNSFTVFYEYVGKCPSPEHSIERIDVNGNYEPGNVVWAIKSVQAHNQRIRRANTSGYKGVYWRKDIKKWVASIAANGKRYHLGIFSDIESASIAYEEAASRLFGKYEDVIPPEIIDTTNKQSILEKKQIAKIMNNIKIGDSFDSCWQWEGRISKGGYGMVYFKDRTCTAHRAVYEILIAEIPGEMQLNHDCHTKDRSCEGGITCLHRRCVNPDHLSMVTPHQNLRLDKTLATINANKTHCDRGHPLKGANLRISYASGSKVRFCKQCDKIRNERHKVKRRKIMEAGGQNVDPRTLGKTHCKNGHELTDEIIKYGTRGYYYCILCDKAKQERRKARHHEKMLAEGREIRSGPKLKTHCIHGHPFDEANTYISPSDGRRHCRICLARIAREDRAKKKTQSKT